MEGASAKICAIEDGLNSEYGINYDNQIYSLIDEITKEDIINFAQNVFSNNPVYSITATQDTLDSNKEFLNSLKKWAGGYWGCDEVTGWRSDEVVNKKWAGEQVSKWLSG